MAGKTATLSKLRAALLAPVAAALVLLPAATASHTPNPSSVTIAGSLQSELGCPGDWRKVKLAWPQQKAVLDLILADSYLDSGPPEEPFETPVQLNGPQAAVVRYSREFVRCACCDAPLSDPVSRAQGIGPVCITRFAA